MKRTRLLIILLFSVTFDMVAQVTSCASFMKAKPKADVVVPFRFADEGQATPLEWGLDVAWISDANMRTGVFFAGQDVVDIVRVSFRPTESVEGGTLSESQLGYVKTRAEIVKRWCKSNVQVNINSDPGDGDAAGVNSWYNAYSAGSTGRGQRWAKCIDLHYDAFKAQGLTNIVSISPFNEPDYGWGQGYSNATRQADFLAIAKSLREDYGNKYDGVRICGGNTLNDDRALEWWTYLKAYLQEGNTHQLAGDFDHYADFFTKVREAGHHATADELHNTMEAMVGVEYGLQTGIWWGTAEYTRGQFMKATYQGNPGRRLGYAEHRANWTAASVYRHTDGTVQGFGGTSERQAVATDFCFLSLDRPVWYDGERGRDYVMSLPGGTGYQDGQTNAETLVNIQGGADVMPHIEGTYKVVNVGSGLLMGYSSKPSASSWTSATLRKNNNTYKFLQWQVLPVEKNGDYAYYTFLLNTDEKMYLDIRDWNYNVGADVGVYKGGLGTNEQWYLQYAGEGAFYIRSRYSTKCLEAVDGKTTPGTNVQMGEFTGAVSQQWRFIPTNVTPDMERPNAPTALKAVAGQNAIKLTWDASTSKDVEEYVVVRNGYVLMNGVTDCEFTDNETEPDSIYSYEVYAIDKSLNQSERSNAVAAVSVTDEKGKILSLTLDGTLYDTTENGNHGVSSDITYVENGGHQALSLSGTNQFVQLPYTIASHDEMTISCWVYYRGGGQWQRVFDFGNGTSQYMFLTTNGGKGPRFAIKNGGEEETVDAGSSLISNRWHHLAVTIGNGKVCLYVNGVLKGTNENLTIRPSDIRPALNYIGRSQFVADSYLKGYIDDFVIYNYPLAAEEIENLANGVEPLSDVQRTGSQGTVYDLSGRKVERATRGIVVENGRKRVVRPGIQ